MGLQFVDINGNERTLNVEDMKNPNFQESYSDLFKSLNGFRPRGFNPQTMLHFFDTYEEQYKAHEDEETARLAEYSKEDGIEYRNWFHFYEEKERQDQEAYEREKAEHQAAQDHLKAFNTRGSALPFIEAWEYGTLG